MKIGILSDIHSRKGVIAKEIDFSKLTPVDVFVVAGDLATGDNFVNTLLNLRKNTYDVFKEIVCVQGNHDYYLKNSWKYSLPGENKLPDITPSVKDNFVKKITDDKSGKTVAFICTPMWTPVDHNVLIAYSLNDYNCIPGFTLKVCTQLFWDNVTWLEEQVKLCREAGDKIVIVTHHLPRPELIDPTHLNSEINDAFCVLIKEAQDRLNALKPELWIHGHSHNFLDITIDGTRYVRNPYGYDWGFREETGYKKDFVIEI